MGRKPINKSICRYRPEKCFECPFDDCICPESRNKAETEFVTIGMKGVHTKYEKSQVFGKKLTYKPDSAGILRLHRT